MSPRQNWNVPGTNLVCPRDEVGPSREGNPGILFLIYTAEAQFVPGTTPVRPWDIPETEGGRPFLSCLKFTWLKVFRSLYTIYAFMGSRQGWGCRAYACT